MRGLQGSLLVANMSFLKKIFKREKSIEKVYKERRKQLLRFLKNVEKKKSKKEKEEEAFALEELRRLIEEHKVYESEIELD